MTWRDRFDELGDHVERIAGPGERFSLWLQAEDSDFVRFNGGRVRQAGTVHKGTLSIRWIVGCRHATSQLTLTGDPAEDRRRAEAEIAELRALVPLLPEDPHLRLPDAVNSTEDHDGGASPEAAHATEAIVAAAGGDVPVDLVGLYAGGASHRAYRDGAGQRNWFTSHGYVFDWCLVHSRDKAVKRTLAGPSWDDATFAGEMARARQELVALGRPSRRIEPGTWRAYLTPKALGELLGLAARDGFSARAHHQRRSCLQRLVSGERVLHPSVTLRERVGGGLAPRFTSDGFVKPDVVTLVEGGRHVGALVGPRSAVEQGVACNGADDHESPDALEMLGGTLSSDEARAALGTGVWVSQLWYCNHSDRNSGRMTGMTRFATLWVEDGEPVAPVEVMRFDDSIYDLLGDRLEGLTAETALLPSTMTYRFRSTDSTRAPGALLSGLTFTL